MLWWTLRQLKADDWRAREGAARKLGEIRDARAIEFLVSALKDKNSHVRQAAEAALIQIGQPSVRPLVTALKKNPDLRQSARETLVRIGNSSVPDLGHALYEPDLGTREIAAAALGTIGDDAALEHLLAALKQGDFSVKEAAAAGLVRIGKAAVRPLVAALRETKPRVRETAAAALVRIGASAIEPLITALEDSAVRETAMEALSKIDPQWTKSRAAKKALPSLLTELRSGDDATRRAAAIVLGEMGDAQAIESLIAAARDPNEGVREAAIAALGELGDPSAWLPLVALIRESEGKARSSAAAALVRIGKRVVEPLVEVLCHKDTPAREAAAAVLVRIGHSAVEPLVQALCQIDPNFTQSELSAPAAVPFVATGKDQKMLRDTKDGLHKLGHSRVIKHVSSASPATETGIANSAFEATQKPSKLKPLPMAVEPKKETKVPPALPDVETLAAGLEHLDPQVRASAARNLIQLGTALDQPLLSALKSPVPAARRAAAHAMAASGDLRACEALRTDLSDPADVPVIDAAESLVRLGDANVVRPLLRILQGLFDSDGSSRPAQSYKAQRILRLLHRLLEGHARELMVEDLQYIVDFPKKGAFVASARAAGDSAPESLHPLAAGLLGTVTELRELARREIRKRNQPL